MRLEYFGWKSGTKGADALLIGTNSEGNRVESWKNLVQRVSAYFREYSSWK